jgi:hypothetical protein
MLLDADADTDPAALHQQQQQQDQQSAAATAAALLDRLRPARRLDVGGPSSAYPSQGSQQQLQLGPRTPSSASPTGSTSVSAESASAAAALAAAALNLLDEMEEEEEAPLRQRFNTSYSSEPHAGLGTQQQGAEPAGAPPARRLQRLPALRLRTDSGSAADGSLPGGGHSLAPVMEPEGVEEEGVSCEGLAAPAAAAASPASSPGQQLPTPAAAAAPAPRQPSAGPSLYDEIEEIEARLAAAEAKLAQEQQELWGLTEKEADTFPPQLHVRVTPRVAPEAPPPPAPLSPPQRMDSATGSGGSGSLAATSGLVLVSGAHAIPHVAKVRGGQGPWHKQDIEGQGADAGCPLSFISKCTVHESAPLLCSVSCAGVAVVHWTPYPVTSCCVTSVFPPCPVPPIPPGAHGW